MIHKSIEIYYDIADIPNISDRSNFSNEALNFRNEAMEHIESALLDAGMGEWEGAEIGSGEVNFGFAVDDFEKASEIVRQSVQGTQFENIREIQHNEFNEEDFASSPDDIKPLNIFEVIGLMMFKRMPKRFRQGE